MLKYERIYFGFQKKRKSFWKLEKYKQGMSRLKRAFATINNVGGGYYQTGHRPSKLFRQHDPKILVTGAFGQIGTELIPALRDKYGTDNVIASDVKAPRGNQNSDDGPFVYLDVCDYNGMARTVCEFSCDMIFHMGLCVYVRICGYKCTALTIV